MLLGADLDGVERNFMPGRYVLFIQKIGNRLIFQINEGGKLLEVADPEPEV